MVLGLKQSIPVVAKAIPEVTFYGQWLAEKFIDNIDNLIEVRLCVRSIITDNRSANVNAISALIKTTI